MKKLLFILLIIFSGTVSFAQVRAKVVIGNQHRYHRHYVHHRYYVHHRRHYYHRSGVHVGLKARL